MKNNNLLILIYILSIFYCTWRFYKRSIKTSLDGVIGNTPELEILGMLVLAPILMIIDLIVTLIKTIKLRLD